MAIANETISKRSKSVLVTAVEELDSTGLIQIIVTATVGETTETRKLLPQYNPKIEYTQIQFQDDLEAEKNRVADIAAFKEQLREFAGKLT